MDEQIENIIEQAKSKGLLSRYSPKAYIAVYLAGINKEDCFQYYLNKHKDELDNNSLMGAAIRGKNLQAMQALIKFGFTPEQLAGNLPVCWVTVSTYLTDCILPMTEYLVQISKSCICEWENNSTNASYDSWRNIKQIKEEWLKPRYERADADEESLTGEQYNKRVILLYMAKAKHCYFQDKNVSEACRALKLAKEQHEGYFNCYLEKLMGNAPGLVRDYKRIQDCAKINADSFFQRAKESDSKVIASVAGEEEPLLKDGAFYKYYHTF